MQRTCNINTTRFLCHLYASIAALMMQNIEFTKILLLFIYQLSDIQNSSHDEVRNDTVTTYVVIMCLQLLHECGLKTDLNTFVLLGSCVVHVDHVYYSIVVKTTMLKIKINIYSR